MKLFYITTLERMQDVIRSWHSLPLPSGKVLVCVDWKYNEEEFEWAAHPDVIPLPHPIFEHDKPLEPHHLEHLGPRFGLQQGHHVHHVIQAATKEDFWMRLHVL